VSEPRWRNGTGIERPFSALAGVRCRCSSLPVQRVMTDQVALQFGTQGTYWVDQGALQRGLPIGSGDIESAHRYIIQEWLKLPGAWWSPAHIETMLALRLNRANREWQAYWRGVEKEVA
jgi:hypothetical protein